MSDFAGYSLYKRNAQGKIIEWHIEPIGNDLIKLRHGLLGKDGHMETFSSKDAKKECKQRFNAKHKQGYKTIGDLRDNAPSFIAGSENLRKYLETYLPKDNTTIAGDKFCMLAKTLEDNKPFEKYHYDGQWKINGERCLIGAIKTLDIFNPIKLTYQSRRGTDWTDKLCWMDDIIIPKIKQELLEWMIEENVKLDGELYLPGYNINDINHFIKNPNCKQHFLLQYWCYDIAIESMSAEARHDYLVSYIDVPDITFDTKEDHLNNGNQLLILPSTPVSDFQDAVNKRNHFINLGFEGLIMRNIDAEYQFGVRNMAMFKFKKIYDGLFEIIDIVPQNKKENLPLFILRNDINEETFECTINVCHKEQEKFLVNKEAYIGCKAFVEYRERSGVKEVPFHAKIISIVLKLNKVKKPIIKKLKLKI